MPAGLWGAMVVTLSLLPGETAGRLGVLNVPHADKIAHLGVYLILAVLMLHGFARMRAATRKQDLVITVMTGMALGLVLEGMQHLVGAERHFEVLDIIANFIGTLSGSAMFNVLLKRKYHGS
ncbi:MAG: VanZ family protein [Saprospiraceae bacterium]|nr:VanZ family protein [Saprospiraceae bacterium]